MRGLICLFFLVSALYSSAYGSTPIHDSQRNINYVIPQGWRVISDETSPFVSIQNLEETTTINLHVYYFKEPVTINHFVEVRRTFQYDGWQILGDRAGTEFESHRANVPSSSIALYGKQIMDSDLNVSQKIWGEYYFLVDQIGYIISVDTWVKYWPDIQPDIKEFVANFWVGSDQKPTPLQTHRDNPSWGARSADSANRNAIAIEWPVGSSQKTWEYRLPMTPTNSNVPLYTHPVASDNFVYFSLNNTVYALSRKYGRIAWRCDLDTSLRINPILSHSALTLVSGELSQHIIQLHPKSGVVLNDYTVENPIQNDPIVLGRQLFFVDGTTLKALHLDTLTPQWVSDVAIDPHTALSGDGNTVLALSLNKYLYCFHADTGAVLWKIPIQEPLAQAPIILNDKLIVQSTAQPFRKSTLKAIALDSGLPLWSISLPDTVGLACADTDHIVVPELLAQSSDTMLLKLTAFNSHTGEFVWENSVNYTSDDISSANLRIQRPILSEKKVWAFYTENNQTFIALFDLENGIKLPSLFPDLPVVQTATLVNDSLILSGNHSTDFYLFSLTPQ